MTSKQVSLIPTGQPYGQRQETEEAYRQGGIAQTTTVSEGTPSLPTPQPIQQAQPFDGQIDAFTMRTPEPGFQLRQDENARMVNLLDSSPSPVLRDLAQRLRRL